MSITLLNETPYVAQFTVLKGQQVIERLPGIPSGARIVVPTDSVYTVNATTIIDGNTYITPSMDVTSGTRFLAQIKQSQNQSGTYAFELVELPSTNASQLQFEKTVLPAVTFSIYKNGRLNQTVTVGTNTNLSVLNIGDIFYIHAVINGVTTQTVEASNAPATVAAINADSDLDNGYSTLELR
jgi:hypothetical protein